MGRIGLFSLCNFISALKLGGCGVRLMNFHFWFLCITLLLLVKLDLTAFWYCSVGLFGIFTKELSFIKFTTF
jgi:hypothetical protein